MTDLARPASYLELIRGNTPFRCLWYGNVISLFGDWFNTIALYSLILNLSGSEFALGAVFITKMLPWAFVSPIAGVIVDRFDRRKVMIVSDILRAVVVLGFLFIDDPSEVYLIYVLTAAQVIVGSVFHPAQSASIPNIVKKENLVTANTIMAATWSVLLALGAAAGGFAAEWLGLKAVFLLDSASYLFSAFFIYRAVIPQTTSPRKRGSVIRTAAREFMDGLRHLKRNPAIARMATTKSVWAIGGGGLVFLIALMGEAIYPESIAVSIGVLFAVRGLGTGIGPILIRAWVKNERRWPLVLGVCMSLTGAGYLVAGSIGFTFAIAIPILFAHAAGGINWVFSTVMLQQRVVDQFRGRIFATEWLLVMGMESLSILAASLVLEMGLLSLSETVSLFGIISIVSGLVWLFFVVPAEKKYFLSRNIPKS